MNFASDSHVCDSEAHAGTRRVGRLTTTFLYTYDAVIKPFQSPTLSKNAKNPQYKSPAQRACYHYKQERTEFEKYFIKKKKKTGKKHYTVSANARV